MRRTVRFVVGAVVTLLVLSGCSGSVDGPVIEGNRRTGGTDAEVLGEVVIEGDCIYLRQTEIDTRYTNDKTYSISNSPDLVPGDSFHRRVFSTNVSIQNIRSLNMMGI